MAHPRWDALPGALSWPVAGAPHPSLGHGVDPSTVEVRVSPDALAAYSALVPGAVLPAGTAVTASHRGPSGTPGSLYVMTKQLDGVWEYLAAEPDGAVLARGALAACAACHDEAPADHLFGAPTPLRRATAPGN